MLGSEEGPLGPDDRLQLLHRIAGRSLSKIRWECPKLFPRGCPQ
jgi:hypothetical protein